MDTNDFLGSVAQEDVAFTTQIVKTSQVGDNFWKAMIFVESDRFVDASEAGWTLVPGSSTIKALSVTADDFAEHTTGVLRSWLYDLFCNGFAGDCILVACAPHATGETVIVYSANGTDFFTDAAMTQPATIPSGKTPIATGTENQYSYVADPSSAEFAAAMETAYNLMKAYAYHKTVCAAPTLDPSSPTFALDPSLAVALAKLCAYDKGLLSSAPYYPFSTSTPETPTSDPIYAALVAEGISKADAFMSAHQDVTRNAALYSLGLAMAVLNGSGTCVGTSMDMIRSTLITASGPEGTNLPKGVRDALAAIRIQTFKPVGNNSGAVSARGAETLNGDTVQATWILAYVTYMTKVRVAELITTPNFLKNAANYTKILNIMSGYLIKFGESGAGRLKNMSVTAPGFGALPEAAGDEIIVPNAWEATYVDQVRKVQITGTLYIGG